MSALALLDALDALHDDQRRQWVASADYQIEHGIAGRAVHGFAGLVSVVDIVLLAGARFDLPNEGDDRTTGVIIKAIDADGVSPLDLVGWPLADPGDVRTLLGRAPILGLEAAFNPATYYLEHPLIVHRTALAWLQANCEGAAVVIPKLAARTFLEITTMGGLIGAQDPAHACELQNMLYALVDQVEIVIPKTQVAA